MLCFTLVNSMNRYVNDFPPVDFRFSSSPRLQAGGFRLVAHTITFDQLWSTWRTKSFNTGRYGAYVFMLVLNATCAVLLLTYALQFQLDPEPSLAVQVWLSSWWIGSLVDIGFSPLVLLVQFAMIMSIWKFAMPADPHLDEAITMENEALRFFYLSQMRHSKHHARGKLDTSKQLTLIQITLTSLMSNNPNNPSGYDRRRYGATRDGDSAKGNNPRAPCR